MAEEKRRMRPEASSVPPRALTPDQRRALKVLTELLEASLEDLPGEAEWKRDQDLEVTADHKERSRLLLLGGGRGSGKTTVARSLRAMLDIETDFSRSVVDELLHTPEEDEERASNIELARAIGEVGKHVIVLEPLSMENTPSESNILAALLARIEELLFPRLTHEDVPTTTGEGKRHRAVLDLLRLQTDVALAWNGNLVDRKGQLDPDNYAMEELRVERVRLQLRDRFAQALRRTARDSLGRKCPTMFLLIVDDADVSPGQVMDLIERLRMVGVPELAVLLVGNVETIETVFRLDFAHRFRRASGRVDPEEIGLDRAEFASLTNSLARSSLRKHIPYHQRVQLQPLLVRDAIKIAPLDTEGADDLETMLDEVEVPYPSTPDLPRSDLPEVMRTQLTLREFVYPKREEITGGETSTVPVTGLEHRRDLRDHAERSWYVGSRVLADSPRVAMDLWNTLRDATGDDQTKKIRIDPWAEGQPVPEPGVRGLDVRLHLLFRQLAAERLDSKTDFWDEHGKSSPIDSALRERIMQEGNLSALGLSVTHTVDTNDARHLDLGQGRLWWSGHRGLKFHLRKQAASPDEEPAMEKSRASRREIGPLVLVEDLLSLEYRTAAENSTAWTSRRNGELAWVVEQPSVLDDGQKRRCWSTPCYRTIRQVEQFAYVWDGFVEYIGSPSGSGSHADETLAALVDAWVTIHTETLLGLEPTCFRGDSVPGRDRVERARRLIDAMRSPQADEWVGRIYEHWVAEVDRLGCVVDAVRERRDNR